MDWKSQQAVAYDIELCAAIAKGNDDAFTELYYRYHPLIAFFHQYVYDFIERDDYFQEAATAMVDVATNYHIIVSEARNNESFYAFYAESLRHLNANIRRFISARKRYHPKDYGVQYPNYFLEDDCWPYLRRQTNPENQAILSDHIVGYFSSLSERERFILFETLEGKSLTVIARECGDEEVTVANAFYRAKRKLKEYFDFIDSQDRGHAYRRRKKQNKI